MARTAQSTARERILDAAARIMDADGLAGVSTRAIAAAAQVQPPAIYRTFGDKQGLLDALAVHQFEQHLIDKASLSSSGDPVDDLRAGWDQHVRFGLEHPDLYVMVYGGRQADGLSAAAEAAWHMLLDYVHRAALAGRLRVDEHHAAQVMHAAGRGVTLALLGMDADRRDPTVSTLTREAVLARITTPATATPGITTPGDIAAGAPRDADPDTPAAAAITLAARLDAATPLTDAERALLREWLHRIATDPSHPEIGDARE